MMQENITIREWKRLYETKCEEVGGVTLMVLGRVDYPRQRQFKSIEIVQLSLSNEWASSPITMFRNKETPEI